MITDDVAVGAIVRYPRTGTTWKVLQVEEIDGRQYAELDSTGLYYRVDELVSVDRVGKVVKKIERTPESYLRDFLKEEEELQQQLKEVWEKGVDQSCEGGG